MKKAARPQWGIILALALAPVLALGQQVDESARSNILVWPIVPGIAAIQRMTTEAVPPSYAATRLTVEPSVGPMTPSGRVRTNEQIVGALSLHPALLSRPTTAAVDFGQPILGVGLPRQYARIAVSLEGLSYELFFLSETADPEYGLRHVTLAILNQPGSYARFSVHDERALVYGHLYTSEGTFRITPSSGRAKQNVHRLTKAVVPGATQHSAEAVEKDWLARRHQQIEVISEIQPSDDLSVQVDDQGRGARIIGGNLGFVRAATAADFIHAMKRLSAVSLVSGHEVFRVSGVRKFGADTLVTFQQLIGDIPTYATNEVSFDSKGTILHFSTRLLPGDAQPVRPNLSEQQAVTAGLAAWGARYGSLASEAELVEPVRLYYSDWDAAKGLTLQYELRFTVTGNGPFIYRALVNAVTGDTEIRDLTLGIDFGHSICSRPGTNADVKPPGGGKPKPVLPPAQFCTDAGVEILYSTNPGARPAVCPRPPSKGDNCPMRQNIDADRVLTDMDVRMRASSQLNRPESASDRMPRCCIGMGHGETQHIDVITNSELTAGGGSFAVGKGQIYLANGDTNMEVLVHEWAHLYHNTYNDRLGAYSDLFAGAIREGLADTIAGLYGAISSESAKFGDPFIHGDGDPPLTGSRRDGTVDRTWADIRVLGESHLSGQVFLNFFYRLKRASPSTSYERLLGIALGTLATIGRTDNRQLQVSDFRSAVINTLNKDTESELLVAVNDVYEAMYGAATGGLPPPGAPGESGPVGAPVAPASLFGNFAYCGIDRNVLVTVFNLGWTAVGDATEYRGYTRATTDFYYSYSATIPAPSTSAYVFTNIAGDVRMTSCNGAGCSGLSNSSFEVTHLPQCANF